MAQLKSTTVVGNLSVTGKINGYSLMANVPAVSTSQNGYVLQVVNGQLTPVQLYQYSTTDLTAGTSTLATGCLYYVYQ